MSGELFIGVIAVAAITILGAVMNAVTSAAYRNGVVDGYRAAKRPLDGIHEHNGVNEILRRAGEFR